MNTNKDWSWKPSKNDVFANKPLKPRKERSVSKAKFIICNHLGIANSTSNKNIADAITIRTGKPHKNTGKGRKKIILWYAARHIGKPDKTQRQNIDFYRSREWRELRYKVLKKYNRQCMCCGATPSDGTKIHVDHIKPRSKCPELALVFDNLQVLCEECNLGKSNKDDTDFR